MASGYDGRHGYERHSQFKDLTYCLIVDDDFTDATLDTTHRWTLTAMGAGTALILDGVPNGVLRFTSGIVAGQHVHLEKNDIRQVSPLLRPLMCVGIQMPAIVPDEIEIMIGFVDVLDTDHCIFRVDRSVMGDLSIHGEAFSGGGQTRDIDTGLDLDLLYHIWEIYIDETGTPYFYIDGVPVGTGEAADVDPTEFFQPYAEIHTEAGNQKQMDLDFIKVWQMRD